MVVYDPDARYRYLCLEMGSETLRVIDATKSCILSREDALKTLNELGRQGTKLEGMLVYMPEKAPLSDGEKQHDPFTLYTVYGRVFPDGDDDEFMSICLRARTDHATEIRRIFNDDANPGFQVIDAMGRGMGWPNLQVLLGVKPTRDILFALLSPSESRKEALKGQDAWVFEAKELLSSSRGWSWLPEGNLGLHSRWTLAFSALQRIFTLRHIAQWRLP